MPYLDDLTPASGALLLDDGVDEPLLLAFRVGWTIRRTWPGGQVAYQLNARLGRRWHHWVLLRQIGVLEELTGLQATGELYKAKRENKRHKNMLQCYSPFVRSFVRNMAKSIKARHGAWHFNMTSGQRKNIYIYISRGINNSFSTTDGYIISKNPYSWWYARQQEAGKAGGRPPAAAANLSRTVSRPRGFVYSTVSSSKRHRATAEAMVATIALYDPP